MRKSKRLLQSKTSTPRGSGRRRTMSGSGAVVDQHELLVAQLRDLGLEVKDVEGDGNCLFR